MYNHKISLLILVFSCITSVTYSIPAQLLNYINQGLSHGPEIKSYEAAISIQEIEKQKSFNRLFPQITATFKLGYLDDHVTGRSPVANVITTLNGKIEKTEFDVNRINQAKHTNTLNFDFKQMLFDNRVLKNIGLNDILLNKKILEMKAKRTGYILSVIEHYWKLKLTDIDIDHQQKQVLRKKRHLKSLSYKVKNGLLDENTLEISKLELKTLLYDIEHKQASFTNKLNNFKDLLGLEIPIEWQNDTTYLNIRHIENKLNKLTLNSDPNIQTQIIDKGIEASTLSLDIIRGNTQPYAYLFGGLEFFGEDSLEFGNSVSQFYSGTNYLAVVFSLDINAFLSFGEHNYTYDTSKKNLFLLKQKKEALQKEIKKNLLSIQLEFQKNRNELTLTEELIDIQKHSLNKVESLYKSQVSSQLQLIERKESLSDAMYKHQLLLIKSEIILSKLFAINGNIDDYFDID